jgi:predicted RNA binding protein YcfA (HicA-like mRNA interferase family)
MSPKLRRLTGNEVISVFKELGFSILSQRGSHVKLRRFTSNNEKQTLTIPSHPELDTGTLKAIYRQASRFVSNDVLARYFYTD